MNRNRLEAFSDGVLAIIFERLVGFVSSSQGSFEKVLPNLKTVYPTPTSPNQRFEIPADNVERAKKFYGKLFGWKIKKFPGPTAKPYWHIDTGGSDDTPDGGMMERQHPEHGITNYVSVASVNQAAAKVEKLGGKICMPKTAVPQMGYFVVCQDTENNMFALWEINENAE